VPADAVGAAGHADAVTAVSDASGASRPAAGPTDATESDAQAEIDILEGHA